MGKRCVTGISLSRRKVDAPLLRPRSRVTTRPRSDTQDTQTVLRSDGCRLPLAPHHNQSPIRVSDHGPHHGRSVPFCKASERTAGGGNCVLHGRQAVNRGQVILKNSAGIRKTCLGRAKDSTKTSPLWGYKLIRKKTVQDAPVPVLQKG